MFFARPYRFVSLEDLKLNYDKLVKQGTTSALSQYGSNPSNTKVRHELAKIVRELTIREKAGK